MFTSKDTAGIGPFNMHRKAKSDIANDQMLVFCYIQFTYVMPNDLPLYSFHAAERVNDMDSAMYLTFQIGQCLRAQFLCISYDVQSWQQCDKYVISLIFFSLFQSHIMSALAPSLVVTVLFLYWFLEFWNIYIIETKTRIVIMVCCLIKIIQGCC